MGLERSGLGDEPKGFINPKALYTQTRFRTIVTKAQVITNGQHSPVT